MFSFGKMIPILVRLAMLVTHFFVLLYCVYSQISPLCWKSKVMYATLPE